MPGIILLKSLKCFSRRICLGLGTLLFLSITGVSVAQTPFTCQDGMSYLTHAPGGGNPSTNLYSVDLISTVKTLIAAPMIVPVSGNRVNAIGYNVLDNFIWGSATGTNSIVKIGSDGIVQSFAVTGLPAANYIAGDMDGSGNLYLYIPNATTMYKVNVATLTVSTITLSAGSNTADISVVPDGSKILGFNNDSELVTFTVTGSTASLTEVAVDVSFVPAPYNTYLGPRGYLYVQSSVRGDTYMLDPNGATPDAEQIGPNTFGNDFPTSDGARCPSAELLVQPQIACAGVAMTLNDISQSVCHSTGNIYVYKTDIQTGTRVEFGALITAGLRNGHLDALGYNAKDGYLWAARGGSRQLARIGDDGSVKFFPIEGFSTEDDCGPSYTSADIDKNGIMYLNATRPLNYLTRIDLNPASPTYLTVLSSMPITNLPNSEIGDIALNPKDNFLYTITASQHVYRINPVSAVATDLGITGVPAGTGFPAVISFMDAAGNFYYQLSTSAVLFKVKNTHLGNSAAFMVRNDLAPQVRGDGASCKDAFLEGISVSGNVWDDANGNLIQAGGELNTVTDDASQTLTVYLYDADGLIVAKTPVASDGTWSFPRVPEGTFTAALSNDASLEVGSSLPVPAILPGSGMWVFTGINFPGATGTQAGTNAGIVVIGTTAAITDVNFGIEKIPTADDKTFQLDRAPARGASITLNGTWTDVVKPTQLTGTDYEDGAYDGVTNAGPSTTIQIISLPVALDGTPVGGVPELTYGGSPVVAGAIITNYNQNNLVTTLNGSLYKGLSFTYQTIDAAGRHSATATYSIRWDVVLPVKLVSFGGSKENNVAKLSWATSEETNADRFEIEGSGDAKTWKLLGSVIAKGESATRFNYTFEDVNPNAGSNYYRLKMIDKDDTYAFSKVLHMEFEGSALKFASYPNPASEKLFFKELKPGMVRGISIVSTSGKIVHKSSGISVDGIDVSNLPAGLYVVKFTLSNGTHSSGKVMISR